MRDLPTVQVISHGRSGAVRYAEGGGQVRDFYWELGAGPVVAWVVVPTAAEWALAVPWASGRREAVLARVAAEVRRHRCPGCRARIGADVIEFLEPLAAVRTHNAPGGAPNGPRGT